MFALLPTHRLFLSDSWLKTRKVILVIISSVFFATSDKMLHVIAGIQCSLADSVEVIFQQFAVAGTKLSQRGSGCPRQKAFGRVDRGAASPRAPNQVLVVQFLSKQSLCGNLLVVLGWIIRPVHWVVEVLLPLSSMCCIYAFPSIFRCTFLIGNLVQSMNRRGSLTSDGIQLRSEVPRFVPPGFWPRQLS